MGVELELLGEFRARLDGHTIDVGPARQRYVLAVLAVDVNRPVSLDQLIDRVWGEAPPPRAAGTSRSYLSRLRQALSVVDGCDIRRVAGGYLLDVDERAVDLHRYRQLVTEARGSEDGRAARLFQQAQGLWRGAPLAGLDTPWAVTVRNTVQAEHFVARLDFHDVQLRRGQHAVLVPDLAELAAANPLDERLASQLMLAWYRSGRQADALAHYEQLRRRLADELGADPDPALQRLHQQVLTADAARPAGAASVPVPRQLPAPPPVFTGRSRELAALDAAVDGRGEKTVVVSAIGGVGGVGKTWLALHWAHQNADRFPDGQLYVNLRGFDPSDSPLPAGVAVRTFLDAFAVDPAVIPVDLDAQTALYRSLIADKRMLIVLDNARDTTQITSLLPGSSRCVVLITSRRRLAGLVTGHGATPIAVDVLDHREARRMFTGHLGARRVDTEPDAVTELLAHCAGLPLALGIVAARATMHPDLPLASIAEELRDAGTRLDALDAGEDTADVRAVFSWSYRTVSTDAARLFRLLGIHPGPDISRPAAASMAGVPVDQVRPLLAELCRAHLLTEPTPGRFAVHDLLRTYAAERAGTHDTEADRRAAVHRAIDHYLHTAYDAALRFYPQRHAITPAAPLPGVCRQELADRRQATDWFTVEHPVLLSIIREAADAGLGTHTWQLAWALADYLILHGHWHDHLTVQDIALSAAQRCDDLLGQAHARQQSGRTCGLLGRYDDAYTRLDHALTLLIELGDQLGQAHAHQTIGWVLHCQGRYQEALTHTQHALDVFQEIGNTAGLAAAGNAVGWLYAHLGDHDQAIEQCRQALRLHEELGNQHGQAATLDSLGYAYHHLGRYDDAITCYRNSLSLHREKTGDRYREGETLNHIGDTHRDTGDIEAAREAWQRALDILDQLGHPDAEEVRAKLRHPVESGS